MWPAPPDEDARMDSKRFGVELADAALDDAKRFGIELADTAVGIMQTERASSEEASILCAQEIVRRSDAMAAAGKTSEAVSKWTGHVVKAYGERLDQRIKETEDLVNAPLDTPQ